MKTDEIIKIEKYKKINAIDLQVLKNQNFILENGIISHNSAKTTIVEKYTEIEYEKGFKIVDVWDSKNDFEGAYRLFPPSEKQIKIMKYLAEKNGFEKYEGKTYPVRIYHPLCAKIDERLPACFHIFTIPLNSLDLESISFLAEDTKPSVSSKIIYNLLKNLDRKSTLIDLFDKINVLSVKASEHFAQQIKLKTLQAYALKLFIEFEDEYTISSDLNCLSLTDEKFISEMNDTKTFTVFSTKWINNKRLKYFVTLWIMNKIAKLKDDGKINPKVIFILRDLHTLAPKYYGQYETYKESMIERIFTILSTFRSKDIEIIADNQDPTTLSLRLSGQFTEVLVGSVFHPGEISFFAESGAKMDNYILSTIYSLRHSDVKRFYDIGSGNFIIPFFPRHRHKESQDNFFKYWEIYYSNKSKDFTDLIKESKLEFNSAKERVLKGKKEFIEEEKGEKIKIEEGLPEEIKKLKEFVRVDVEKILKCSPDVAQDKIQKWKRRGLIEMIGNPSSKNVKYRIL